MNKNILGLVFRFIILLFFLGIALIIGQNLVLRSVNNELNTIPVINQISRQKYLTVKMDMLADEMLLATDDATLSARFSEFQVTLRQWQDNQQAILSGQNSNTGRTAFSEETAALLTKSGSYYQQINRLAEAVVAGLHTDSSLAGVQSVSISLQEINVQSADYLGEIDRTLAQLTGEALAFIENNTNAGILLLAMTFAMLAIWTLLVFIPLLKKLNSTLNKLQAELTIKKFVNEETDRFKLALNNTSNMIVITGLDGSVLYANEAAEKMTGYQLHEILGKKDSVLSNRENLMTEEDYTRMWQTIKKDRKFYKTEIEKIKKNGEHYFASLIIAPYFNRNKDILGFISIEDDITSRIAAEKQLKIQAITLAQEKSKVEALLKNLSDPIVAVDKDGMAFDYNQSLLEDFQISEKDLSEKPFIDTVKIYTTDDLEIPREERPLFISQKNNQQISKQVIFHTKDNIKRYYELKSNPIILDSKSIGTVCLFHDITGEKEIENAKTEFVTLASHQLRTPLSIIGWYLELLESEDMPKLTAVQEKYLQEIVKSNERMKVLVSSLLNLSRLELGTFLINPKMQNIRDIAHSIVEDLDKSHILHHHEVQEYYAEKLPEVNLDEVITRILLDNLITNAYKYSPAGSLINIYIDVISKGDYISEKYIRENSLLIKVEDHGYGIPLDQQNKIFTKFVRASNITNKEMAGTGLGLYMVKKICDELGSLVWFTSREGEGSTFYLTIPLTGMKKRLGKKLEYVRV